MNTDKKEIKKFGFILTFFLLMVAMFSFFKRHEVRAYLIFGLAGTVLLLNLINTKIMMPVYIAAMKSAAVLGFINTRIILFFIFYFIFTPIAFVLRLFGKDFLEREKNKDKISYWSKREYKKNIIEASERLF